MAMNWLARLACKAPVPIYPAIGRDALDQVQDWSLDARLQWVRSPRQARILLVAGEMMPDAHPALRRIHDQLPAPAVTLWWRCTPLDELADRAIVVEDIEQLGALACEGYRSLLLNERHGESPLCADKPPAPWEGLGEHGQGGEGMMGGKPYGRPMAMTSDDLRDGLELDPLAFSVGPFWPVLAPGLSAHFVLHGDVVAELDITSMPCPVELPAPFGQALQQPVAIADLEMARARYHLRRLGHSMWINGLESASQAVLRRIPTLQPGDSIEPWRRWLRRLGFFVSAGADKGKLSSDQAERLGGPAARAAGLALDARVHDREYRKLGFEPICRRSGTCRARWQQWLDEAAQSLNLAARADSTGAKTSQTELIESPRGIVQHGRAPEDASSILCDLLPGLEWSEAIATIASLDLAAVAEPADRESS
ncbi:MAG: hypothetical protein RQ741_02445 [Wenzhouxiangellaceae bacterium]|nr:hypothetical protein [Wenzhouxiangellaceae bacterium]